jgi:hypothetical protein
MKLGIQNEHGKLIYRPSKLENDFGSIQYLKSQDKAKRFSTNPNYPLEHTNTSSKMDIGKNLHVLPDRRFDNENLIVKMEASVFGSNDQGNVTVGESKITWTRRRLNEGRIRDYFEFASE